MRSRLEQLRETVRLRRKVITQKHRLMEDYRMKIEHIYHELREAGAKLRTAEGRLKEYQDSQPPMSSTAGGTYEEVTL